MVLKRHANIIIIHEVVFKFTSFSSLPFSLTGLPFWCLLDIVPIKNEKHEVVLFLASHKDVTRTEIDDYEENKEIFDIDRFGNENQLTPPRRLSANHYHRRRSRAVLYQLSGHYRRSHNMKSKLKLNNVITFTQDKSPHDHLL